MRKLITLSLAFIGLLTTSVSAQIVDGLDTLYGHEWINSDQTYALLNISEDGLYQISYEEIIQLGWPVATINSHDYQLFHFGQSVYYHASNNGQGPLQAGDFLVFYGQKNRGELDKHLFRDAPNQQLNPQYSLYSDQASYFLSWATEGLTPYTIVPNDIINPPAAQSFVWRKNAAVFSDYFLKEYQRFSGATLYYSHYSIGEGYGNRSDNDLLADGSTEQEVIIDLPAAYTNGPAAQLETRYAAALFLHIQRLSANGQQLRVDTFNNWRMLNVQQELPMGVLSSEQAQLRWEGFGGLKDEVSVGFAEVRYPAIPDAGGNTELSFELEGNNNEQYLEITNFEAATAVVYDLTNGIRVEVETINEGLLQVLLPPATGLRQILISASDTPLPTTSLRLADLALPAPGGAEYIILTHSQLRADGDAVQDYADYRASALGGGYNTAVVNIDHLFDQFGYGVQQHPLAIRNFVIWQQRLNPNFKFLFIVGKGREYKTLRDPAELEAALGSTLFVPSFGFPASDNLLVSKITTPTPEVFIGRLPAINPAEVSLYLNKVRGLEMEVANAPQRIDRKNWMKQVLHLGGGSTASEQQSIRGHLESMKDVITDGKFGGEVSSFYKTSMDQIQVSQSELIFDRINEGISVLSFFGHSSAGSFDFSIDNPNNYHNVDKYPLMISMGCYSGNMFDDFRSIGERFIFLENGGAMAYGASRGVGFVHALGAFGNKFYDKMSNDLYGQTIGEGFTETIRSFEHLTDLAFGGLNEQFSLQGDPVIRLNPAPGPDFTIDANSVISKPAVVSVQNESFELSFDIHNLGYRITDSIDLKIEQQLPDGSIQLLLIARYPSPGSEQKITANLPTLGKPSVGLNTILITIDPDDLIAESPDPGAETNNQLQRSPDVLGVPLFIVDNTAVPVWPPQYGLVNTNNVRLKASITDVLAPEREYILQLDTLPTFDNPLISKSIVQRGGVVRWQPEITLTDSTVYYWRVSPDTSVTQTPDFVWETSSFTALSEAESGWGQGHWGQFREGLFDSLEIDSTNRFDFQNDFIDIRIINKYWTDESNKPGLIYDNTSLSPRVRPWNYMTEGVAVVVGRPNTGTLWANPPVPGMFEIGDYGIPTGDPTYTRHYAFPTETVEQRSNMLDFLENVVPDDHFVFLFTVVKNETANIRADQWALDSLETGMNIFQFLEVEGAQLTRELETFGSVPYILIYQKGVGVVGETISPSMSGELTLEGSMPQTFTSASFRSPILSKVQMWEDLSWHIPTLEANDSSLIELWGGATPDILSLLWDNEGAANGKVAIGQELDLPEYLQLRWKTFDETNRTSEQLAYWHLTNVPLPDLALDPVLSLSTSPDTLEQGQLYDFSVAVTNLSPTSLTDSFSVNYDWISNSLSVESGEKRFGALAENEVVLFELSLPTTANTSGEQQLIVQANPANDPEEKYLFNNNLNQIFQLDDDKIAPVIQVSFDGAAILNGDLVSSEPTIVVQVQDENIYLPLDNPEFIEIIIIDPLGDSKIIELTATNVNFSHSINEEGSEAKMEFREALTLDGLYQLHIRGSDASGNLAGRLLYEVDFEVITRQSISNILPYPNPFTTQASFVYTLTGGQVVDDYYIQVLTVSGRLVKTLNSTDLGPLRPGTHQTDHTWDGTDDYGDRLANGVYLYRVVSRNAEQESIESFARDEVDGFFVGGLGKIVILR